MFQWVIDFQKEWHHPCSHRIEMEKDGQGQTRSNGGMTAILAEESLF